MQLFGQALREDPGLVRAVAKAWFGDASTLDLYPPAREGFVAVLAEASAALRRDLATERLYRRLGGPARAPAAGYLALADIERRRGTQAAPVRTRLPAMLLLHHLGLGDHLLCNGLVRHHADRIPSLGLFVTPGYAASVAFMYRDDPRIRLIVVRDHEEAERLIWTFDDVPAIRIGFEALGSDPDDRFAERFYAGAGLAYDQRWDGWTLARDARREDALLRRLMPEGGPFLFLHDDPSRGLTIDRSRLPSGLPIVFPRRELTDNVFDYCGVLERAAEIHCMDSVFRHIADVLPLDGTRLVLHHYVKSTDVPSRHPWVNLY